MQYLKSMGIILFIGLTTILISCGGNNDHNPEDHSHGTVHHGEGNAYNAAYVCPMHCEGSGSEQAGNCPACGMDYVKSEDHVGDGHSH